jgi:hypothetical protein
LPLPRIRFLDKLAPCSDPPIINNIDTSYQLL